MNTIALCLATLAVLGIAERLRVRLAMRAIPIRILVNGTRGKSTVTRMIRGAIAASGKSACAKTTGTEARFIHPDGHEETIHRRAPASIREQLWALERARKAKAEAIVLECMAIRPELQWICEHAMLRSTIGVVTNARVDHTEIMGADVEALATALGNTVPEAGMLVTGQGPQVPVLEAIARSRGTRLVVAPARLAHLDAAGLPSAPWWQENASIALTIARELGIPDSLAMKGIAQALPDPGALAWVTLNLRAADSPEASRRIRALDASAANDPESLQLILESILQENAHPVSPDGTASRTVTVHPKQTLLLMYNHRSDRQRRLEDFVRWFQEHTRASPSGSPQETMTGIPDIDATGQAMLGRAAAFSAPASRRFELQSSVQRQHHGRRTISETRIGTPKNQEAAAQTIPAEKSRPTVPFIPAGSRLVITGARPSRRILARLAHSESTASDLSSGTTHTFPATTGLNPPHSAVAARSSPAAPLQALPSFLPSPKALTAILEALDAFDPGEKPLVVLCGNTKGFILRATATDREFA